MNETVEEFIKAINNQEIEKMDSLISKNHNFTDPHGISISGRENCLNAWRAYFNLFKNYKIEIEDVISYNKTVIVTGVASADIQNKKSYKIPAAFKAKVENEKIESRQVFADSHLPLKSLE